MDKYTRLTAGLLEARKAKSTLEVAVLSTLLGEVQGEMKNSDEPSAVIIEKIAKKFKKGIEGLPQNAKTEEELSILEPFLPETLSREQIIEQLNLLNIKEMATFGQKMSAAMQSLKGQVDGRVLGEIIRMEF